MPSLAVTLPTAAASLSDGATRARYADAILVTCLAFAQGDLLVIRGEPAHRELVVSLAESAYRLGARHVDVWETDPRVRRARIAYGSDAALGNVSDWDLQRLRACIAPDTSIVSITGREDPQVLADLPSDRVGEDYRRPARRAPWFMRAQALEKVRFCVAAWPTPAWASNVYPDLSVDDAVDQLG